MRSWWRMTARQHVRGARDVAPHSRMPVDEHRNDSFAGQATNDHVSMRRPAAGRPHGAAPGVDRASDFADELPQQWRRFRHQPAEFSRDLSRIASELKELECVVNRHMRAAPKGTIPVAKRGRDEWAGQVDRPAPTALASGSDKAQ